MNIKRCNFCDEIIKDQDIVSSNYKHITIQTPIYFDELNMNDIFDILKKQSNRNQDTTKDIESYEMCNTCYNVFDMLLYHRYNKVKEQVNSIRKILRKKPRELKILGDAI